MAARDYVFLCLTCGETFTTRAVQRVYCPHCREKGLVKTLVDDKDLDDLTLAMAEERARPNGDAQLALHPAG